MTQSRPLKLGVCVICGERVFGDQKHLKASEGYCHHLCLSDAVSA